MLGDVVKKWIDSLPDWVMGRHNEADPRDIQDFVDHYDQLLSDYRDYADKFMIDSGQDPIFKGRSDAE